MKSRLITPSHWLPLCLIALMAALAIPALALAQTSGNEVPPDQVPGALAATIRTNETARARTINTQFVGWCSAPNPPSTPGTCASVTAIQSGYAKVVIGRAGAEGIGTFVYQHSGDTWKNIGQVAEGADAPPFPPSSAASPAAPNTGSGTGSHKDHNVGIAGLLLMSLGLGGGAALAVAKKTRH